MLRSRGSGLGGVRSALCVLTVIKLLLSLPPAQACPPGFFRPPPTLREEVAALDVVVFCRLLADPPRGGTGKSTFEVTEVLKGNDMLPERLIGRKSPPRFMADIRTRDAGSEFLVFGRHDAKEKSIAWGSARPVNDREIAYTRCVSSFTEAMTGLERLKLLLPFVGASDDLIGADIVRELNGIQYADLRQVRGELSAAKLRDWITDPTTTPGLLRHYFAMLSLCGTSDDLPLVKEIMEKRTVRHSEYYHVAMACYLTLGGEEALTTLEELYFKPRREHPWIVQDLYAVAYALSFVSRETQALPRERIVAGFRSLLERRQVADLAMRELATLEDWDCTPRLLEMFRDADKNKTPWIKISVVNFLRASTRADAASKLAVLREVDPEAVASAERNYPQAKR